MTKQTLKLVIATSVILLNFSCSKNAKNDEENSITQTILTWKTEENRFTAQGGQSFDSGDYISVNITADKNDCLSDIFTFKNYISTYIPKNISSFPYTDTKANVIFHSNNKSPMNALNSTVIVHSISNSEITISVKSETIRGESALGKYTVPYCK